MIQKIKQKLLIMSSLMTIALFGMVPAVALAQSGCDPTGSSGTNDCIQNGLCQGAEHLNVNTTNGGTESCTEQGSGIGGLIKTIINILSIIVGVVAVIMIIIGGFRYITSGGKQESVTGAKNTILYAVIGLVIVALAQIIVRFVLTKTVNPTGS
jgi:hypothetical protein